MIKVVVDTYYMRNWSCNLILFLFSELSDDAYSKLKLKAISFHICVHIHKKERWGYDALDWSELQVDYINEEVYSMYHSQQNGLTTLMRCSDVARSFYRNVWNVVVACLMLALLLYQQV